MSLLADTAHRCFTANTIQPKLMIGGRLTLHYTQVYYAIKSIVDNANTSGLFAGKLP